MDNLISIGDIVIDFFEVLHDEVIGVHVAVKSAGYDVSVLVHPQGVFLPAGLVPVALIIGASRRNVASKNSLHVAVAQVLELDAEPVELAVSGLRFGGTSIDGRIGIEEVAAVMC